MRNTLLLSNSAEAADAVESALSDCEDVLLSRVETADDAGFLVTTAPFDVLIWALDQWDQSAHEVCSILTDVSVPVLVVNGTDGPVPVRPGVRIVRPESLPRLPEMIEQSCGDTPRQAVPATSGECRFEFSFKSCPARISTVRSVITGFVERFTALEHRDVLRMQLVIEEALANAVFHGNLEVDSELKQVSETAFHEKVRERQQIPRYGDRQVHVALAIDHAEVRIRIEDEGNGFDVTKKIPAPEDGGVFLPSGRGLLLMRAFADAVVFNETGNVVTLIKRRIQGDDEVHASAPVTVERAVPVS